MPASEHPFSDARPCTPRFDPVSGLRRGGFYARMTDKDEEGIEAQFIYCQAVAAKEGYVLSSVPDFFFSDDATKGTTKSRLGFDRLCRQISDEDVAPFDRLYVRGQDRLGRWADMRLGLFADVWFGLRGVLVRFASSADQPLDSTDQSDARNMAWTLKRLIDSYRASSELGDILLRTRGRRRTLASNGFWPGTGYTPYATERWIADAKTRVPIERTPIEGSFRREGTHYILRWMTEDGSLNIVRNIFERLENGESLRGVALDLNRRKVPPPGARFRTNRAKPVDQRWTPESIRDIARNPLYCGNLAWGRGSPRGRHLVPRLLSETAVLDDTPVLYRSFLVDPPISEEHWKAVQLELSGHPAIGGRKRAGINFPLVSLVRCAECGRSFTGQLCNRGGRPGGYRYYRHHKIDACGVTLTAPRCSHQGMMIPAEQLEDAACAIVRAALQSGLLQQAVEAEMSRRRAPNARIATAKEHRTLAMAIQKATRQIEYASRREIEASSETSRWKYREAVEDLARRIALLRQQLELVSDDAQYRQIQALEAVRSPLPSPDLAAAFEQADHLIRRRIFRAIIDRLEIDPATRSFAIVARIAGPEVQRLIAPAEQR
jgi:hypothetical protein